MDLLIDPPIPATRIKLLQTQLETMLRRPVHIFVGAWIESDLLRATIERDLIEVLPGACNVILTLPARLHQQPTPSV